MSFELFSEINWVSEEAAEFAHYWRSLSDPGTLPKQSDFDPAAVRHLHAEDAEECTAGERCEQDGRGIHAGAFALDLWGQDIVVDGLAEEVEDGWCTDDPPDFASEPAIALKP